MLHVKIDPYLFEEAVKIKSLKAIQISSSAVECIMAQYLLLKQSYVKYFKGFCLNIFYGHNLIFCSRYRSKYNNTDKNLSLIDLSLFDTHYLHIYKVRLDLTRDSMVFLKFQMNFLCLALQRS